MPFTDASSTTGSSSITNSYDPEKSLLVDLQFPGQTTRFLGKISIIVVHCTNLSSPVTPTQISIKLCSDSDCDKAIVTDTTAILDSGVTTSSSATAIFKLDGIVSLTEGDNCYLVGRTNEGTLDIEKVTITWEVD